MARILGFPNPVNETSARIVATGAVLMSLLFLVTGNGWVLLPLTYGFVARVLTGPTLSPLGRLATQVITPRINREHTFVAGPPKRFAQGIGATFTVTASKWRPASTTPYREMPLPSMWRPRRRPVTS